MHKFNAMFIIEVIIKGGVVLDYVILTGVSNILTTSCI